MKIYIFYALLIIPMLISSINNISGQTTTLYSYRPTNEYDLDDALKMDVKSLFSLNRDKYLEQKKGGKNGGIVADIHSDGKVTIKVRSFSGGGVIYGCYTDKHNTGENYVEKSWRISDTYDGIYHYYSHEAKKGIKNVPPYYSSCTEKQSWGEWFSFTFHLDCPEDLLREIPVYLEVEITNAVFKKCFIPGVGEVTYEYLLALNELKNSTVEIKGSNYEINALNAGVSFGHSDNRYTINSRINTLAGAQLTGLYDSVNDGDGLPPHSYFKIKVPQSGVFYFAVKSGAVFPLQPPGNTLTYPYPQILGPASLIFSQAFSIKDKNNNVAFFDVYRSTKTPNSFVKFTTDESGPFIIAGNFDVSFKEDLTLPANKRKLFHRADWLNEVLVCAHRGIWTKTGSHNPIDYSGIAENTIPAYELAINNPYVDWIEFDARRTSDGVFVAWHDEGISRVSSFPDNQECIPIDEVNARDKLWKDAHQPAYSQSNIAINNKDWNFMSQLHVRDYLGCKVKDSQGNYLHPLKLEEGLQWLANQKSQGKHSIISVDYKDGKSHLDELYELIIKYDLEGQVLLSVYAKEYALADYEAEYGKDFLKQIPLKPTFYEPVKPTDYGGNVLNRFNEYVNAPSLFVAGFTLNVNYDQDSLLIAVLQQPTFPAIANRMWYMTHYVEPFMASINDNNRITTPVDCDPTQHPAFQTCANLFWRADFDWTLNNGTNALFSDNTEALIEYLKAKGKK